MVGQICAQQMAVKIRLQRHGRKQNPYYKIVVADARSPRDGKFIERLGFYNPMTVPATIEIDRDKALEWLQKGAQPTDTVRAILRFKGVLFRKHLLRGIAKGALTQEQADAQWATFIQEKETRVELRRTKTAEQKRAYHAQVSGSPKPAPAPVVEESPAPAEVAEEASAVTPVEETTPAEPVEETPVVAGTSEEAPAAETAGAEEVASTPEEAPADETTAEESAEEPSGEDPSQEG